MRVVRHPEVPLELEAAVFWYEERQAGLGEDFLEEYQTTLRRILKEPERWRKFLGKTANSTFTDFLSPLFIVFRQMPCTSKP